jgi:predicted  nucleic acid-binding Zn-ribbon protein
MEDVAGKSKQRLKQEVDANKKIAVAADSAAQNVAAQNQELRERNMFLEKQCVNADKRVMIYKQATADNLAQTRETELGLVAEIKKLKAEIKQLKGE